MFAASMLTLLPLFAIFVPGIPAVCGVFATTRWWLDRRRLEQAFTVGRERRRVAVNPWRQ